MKSEWKTYTVQELIDLGMLEAPMDGNHGNLHPKVSDYVLEGIPFIMANDLVNGKIDYKKCAHITEAQARQLKKGFAHPGDVLLTHKATIGRTALVGNEYDTIVLTPQITYYRVKKGISNRYLKAYFDSKEFQELLSNWAGSGSTRAYLGITAQRKLPILLPSIDIQNKIASYCESIDGKITVNSMINDNLEQQAAALFSSLYNRSNTEVRYTDLIQILGGGTPKTGETAYWNGNIAFFTPKDVGAPYTFITEKTITEEGLSHCNSRLYPVNTVFVTARGTVGKVGLSGVPMAMNQSCYALVGKETHQLLVYFYTLKAVDRLKHKASGAVFDAITTRDFDSEQIMKLSDDDAKAFLCVAEPMFQEILNNSIENLRLSTLRDFLLPKLMSGEIDVSSVQI
ncbi:restriction endonuclease subunit S [Faecalibacterium prausnitzii]|uniref:Type I restriction modification DNA specificity domain-containing protein n=1 Tax=Faecalibacterium prausnitzii TaxID=853 RepID=A0A291TD92_9FIRM|nr:restriction endonuclease subunit S [Faecalibacterium prausnitzii]ATL91106.1 hypothetical protein CRH10_12810 [Faecalibacterium prausnitzii]